MTETSAFITHHSSLPEESWRSRILQEFQPKIAKLTIVSDPDQLLSEEQMVEVV